MLSIATILNIDFPTPVWCVVILTSRVMLTGLAWRWIIPARRQRKEQVWVLFLSDFARALLIGLTATLLGDWLLYERGMGSFTLSFSLSLFLIVSGVVTGWKYAPVEERLSWQRCATYLMVFAGLISVGLLLPSTGEWVVGGWDPGVYINQGVYVEKVHTFYPPSCPGYELLSDQELSLFTRHRRDYVECYPGIAFDSSSHSIECYFFRLMPTAVAMLSQCGGLYAAIRPNVIFGGLALLMFAACLSSIGSGLSFVVFSTLLLLTHPLWLYQLHLPTTEMLHLLLVSGIALQLRVRGGHPFAPWWLGITIFAGLLNRMSFLPFASMLIVFLAWLDMDRSDRRAVRYERCIQLAFLFVGTAFDLIGAAVTIRRLHSILPAMLIVSGIMVGFALGIDLCVWNETRRDVWLAILEKRRKLLYRGLFVGFVVTLFVFLLAGDILGLAVPQTGLLRTLPFLGPGLGVLALFGGGLLIWPARRDRRFLSSWMSFLSFVSIAIVIQGFIVPIYPWATRRYVPYALPLLVLGAGYALDTVWRWEWHGRSWGRWVAISLLVGVIGLNSGRSVALLSGVKDSGLRERLEAVAEQVLEQDVIVSDHPWWGTPLAMIYGKSVLNGRGLWVKDDPELMRDGLQALRRLHEQGKRIRFFTTVEQGLELYPISLKNISLDWEAPAFIRKELIHGQNVSGYNYRERRHKFRLYTWFPHAHEEG